MTAPLTPAQARWFTPDPERESRRKALAWHREEELVLLDKLRLERDR